MEDVHSLVDLCQKMDGNSIPVYCEILAIERPFKSTILAYKDNILIGLISAYFCCLIGATDHHYIWLNGRTRGLSVYWFYFTLRIISHVWFAQFRVPFVYTTIIILII